MRIYITIYVQAESSKQKINVVLSEKIIQKVNMYIQMYFSLVNKRLRWPHWNSKDTKYYVLKQSINYKFFELIVSLPLILVTR